jgi:hypothetical protein
LYQFIELNYVVNWPYGQRGNFSDNQWEVRQEKA